MYNILKMRITTGGVKLDEIQGRIKRLYANGDLTTAQMEELLELSQTKADPNAERPEILDMIKSLTERVDALEKKHESNTDTDGENGEAETWKPWDGISNKYQYDAVVSHNGKLWRSVFNGQNVWEPGAAGTASLWVEHTEVTGNA